MDFYNQESLGLKFYEKFIEKTMLGIVNEKIDQNLEILSKNIPLYPDY